MNSLAFAPVVIALALAQQAPEDGRWRAGEPLHEPRAGHAAAVVDGVVFISGGSGVLSAVRDFESLDTATGGWSGREPLPAALERHASAGLEGRVYVAGGFTDDSPLDPIADVWVFDPSQESWTEAPDMLQARANFALVPFNGRLYAVGGEGAALEPVPDDLNGESGEPEADEAASDTSAPEQVADMDGPVPPPTVVFDPAKNGWREIGVEPVANRRGAAAVAVDGAIYVMGGVADGQALSRVDVFDIETETWSEGPALPAARFGAAASVLDGVIHLSGGRAGTEETLAEHLTLDPALGVWRRGPNLPSPRSAAVSAAVNDAVYVIGGGAGGGFFAPFTAMDSVEIYERGD